MRVVILGGGYAGVTLVRVLEKRLDDDVELLLVDDTGEHLVQHEVHRVVRRPTLADDITIPLADLVSRAGVREGTVTNVDADARRVTLEGGDTIEYDACAVCLGATTAFYDVDGLREHAIPLKSVPDAERIRAAVLDALADADPGDAVRLVVGGAGLSGVQVAGELAALAREEGATVVPAGGADGDHAHDPADEHDDTTTEDTTTDDDHADVAPSGPAVSVLLLEQLDAVAPAFPENFQTAARNALEDAGVTVQTGATVTAAGADAVDLADGRTLAHDVLVWTGGITGQPALDGTRPEVAASLEAHPGTFVLGDAARVVDVDGDAVPASAQTAIRQAPVVARNVAKLVEGADAGPGSFRPRLDRYDFESPGWVISVGDDAVAQVGPTVVRGTPARAIKATVGAGYLSSVGAVRDAVDLVNDELGLDADPADAPVDLPVDGDDTEERED
jgi:NADH dehydrogenase